MVSPAAAFWLLLVMVLHATSCRGAQQPSSRRLLIRPMPSMGGSITTCRNTNQGPWFMTDDQGKVCPFKELDFTTGCCSGGQTYSCDMCGKEDGCCASFEHCVSCCMAPQNKAEDRRKVTPKAPNNNDSGLWADVFEYCLATCRTHSFSTSHENAYIGPRHHCYSKLGKPMSSPPLPAGALDGVTVLLSASGASCSGVCQGKGLVCTQQHLHYLNSCDQLRGVTNCEAGCEVEQHTATMPAVVDQEAPKQDRPALCLVSTGTADGNKAFSCEAAANHMRRLCACTKAAETAVPAGDAASVNQAEAPAASVAQPSEQQQQQDEAAQADGNAKQAGQQQQQQPSVAAADKAPSKSPAGTASGAAGDAATEPAPGSSIIGAADALVGDSQPTEAELRAAAPGYVGDDKDNDNEDSAAAADGSSSGTNGSAQDVEAAAGHHLITPEDEDDGIVFVP